MTRRIHIIHTNDLHSHFENMPKIATYVQQVKKIAKKNNEVVIVVDLGDHMDRMRFETEGTYGKVNVKILNKTGVQFTTIGNNEGLTFTKDLLEKAYQKRQFKILVSNLKDLHTGQIPEWALPYTIEEIGGIKIGFIGATAPYETFYRLQEWKVEEPLPIIKNIISKIQNQVDIIILLSHLGIKADEKIANEIHNIDLILGGHTHRFFEHGVRNQKDTTLICQVGISGNAIGHVIITLPRGNHSKNMTIEEKTIPVASLMDDQIILDVIDKNRKRAMKELNHTITVLEQPLPIRLEAESPLGNLLADGVRRWANAEIGIVNTGQILEGLSEGPVKKKRLHEICPSPINICKIKLTGKQMKELLEESLLPEKIHYPLKGYGFRGKELGTLAVSGILVMYSSTADSSQKIKHILINEEEVEDENYYTIGTLDMFTFGAGYSLMKDSIQDESEIQYYLPEFLRDILAEQLKNQEWINQAFTNRWIEKLKN